LEAHLQTLIDRKI
jgi:hypothetical protein